MRVKIEELKENLTVEFPDGSTWTFLPSGDVARGGTLPKDYDAETYNKAMDIVVHMPMDNALRQTGKAFHLVGLVPEPSRDKLAKACETLGVGVPAGLMLLCVGARDYLAVACAIHNRFVGAGLPGVV